MKVLYCALCYDYGCIDRGPSFEEVNLGDTLRHMKELEVIDFHFDIIEHQGRDVNAEFISVLEKERPEITFVVLHKDEINPEALDNVRELTTLVSWGCDDHWRFRTGYMQRYAPHFDYCITTCKDAIPDYRAAGQPNVIVSQWGCNPQIYHPSPEGYLYDLSFVGQNYGPRQEVINYLWKRGLNVVVFGRGWPHRRRWLWKRGLWFTLFGSSPAGGYVPYQKVVEIYGRSKINLCLNNNVTGIDNIKGRNFEVPACRGFLITGPAQGLGEYFEIGKEIVVYHNPDDLADKIVYYLEHSEDRETIAEAGYKRVIRDHTYGGRFREIFSNINLEVKGAAVWRG